MGYLPEFLRQWLMLNYPASRQQALAAQAIAPDGSSRQFFRLSINGRNLVLLYSPDNPPESMAWFHFRRHLSALGLPVPDLLAAQAQAGIFLMSDLGSISLQQAVHACKGERERIAALYRRLLTLLAIMHARGLQNLDVRWCFDSPSLDASFLRAKEMAYFYQQVVLRLGLKHTPALAGELDLTAIKAAAAQPWGLVHRDMQSRNIVLDDEGALGIVDFQGARPGPVQYDVASLLNDPYADLPLNLRGELLNFYVAELAGLRDFNQDLFYKNLPWAALSRNLQVLAAYQYLSMEKGKKHFLAYMAPAARNLSALLASEELEELPVLRHIARQLLEL